MMAMKFLQDVLINREHKTLNPKIRICIDCGSILVLQNQKDIMCRDCGNIRDFSN